MLGGSHINKSALPVLIIWKERRISLAANLCVERVSTTEHISESYNDEVLLLRVIQIEIKI